MKEIVKNENILYQCGMKTYAERKAQLHGGSEKRRVIKQTFQVSETWNV